jgi:hypothetical protein
VPEQLYARVEQTPPAPVLEPVFVDKPDTGEQPVRETAVRESAPPEFPSPNEPAWGAPRMESEMDSHEGPTPHAADSSRVNLAELLDRDQTVIELPTQSPAEMETRTEMEMPRPQQEAEEEETIIMDNGSIRSFNSDKFRVPTFVRKQID